MPFTETGKEKAKREAYYKANKERGIRQEKQKEYEMFGTTEQNIPAVDTMGNVTGMKKGGKVKKMADGGVSTMDALKRAGLHGGLKKSNTEKELEDLLPSREKIGSTLRSKLDPETIADMANPSGAVARRVAESIKDVKMPKSYSETSGMKKGGKVSSASKRGDGCAQRGKTKGRMV